MFDIDGKVALVTGGASGIGFETAKELLKNGARGVVIADTDVQNGRTAWEKLEEQFGKSKVLFVETDVSDKQSFEDVFKRTISEFNNIDILVNNAGIFNDANYEKEISINLTGTVHGTLLAHENYILNYKTEAEGIIINISSIAGCHAVPYCPVYGATKSGIVALTLSLGSTEHYERTKIKIASIAPGPTTSNILNNLVLRNNVYEDLVAETISLVVPQTAEFVAKEMMKIIRDKPSGTIWICEDSQEIHEYIPTPPRKNYH